MKIAIPKIFAAIITLIVFSSFSVFSQSIRSMNSANHTQSELKQAESHVLIQKKENNTSLKTNPSSAKVKENSASGKSSNYYNPESFIYSDPRTPRLPLSNDEKLNQANYKKAKEIWIKNNPETYKAMSTKTELTAKQKKEAEEKAKIQGKQ